MNTAATLGGSFTTAEGLTLTRMGYGAMQLAGPGVAEADAEQKARGMLLGNPA